MPRRFITIAVAFIFLLGLAGPALAADADVAALMAELKALKARVGQLESKLAAAQGQAAKAAADAAAAAQQTSKISQQVQDTTKPGWLSELSKRVSVSGAVEFEASWERSRPAAGDSETSSNLELAKAEIIFALQIHKYAKGVIHFLWEQGDDAIGLDEGFILLGQTDDVPFYVMAGRMYPAIGVFDSWFISDPITLEAFETQATAIEVGYAHQWFSIGVGGYNATVHARSDTGSNLNTFFARLNITPPAELLGGVAVTLGFAYTNNIATNNGLGDVVAGTLVPDDTGALAPSGDNTLASLVGGYSASILVEYGMFSLAAEYITAASSFTAADLTMDNGAASPRPRAFNIELAITPVEPLTIAVRYGGSRDMFDLYPESQYGIAASYQLLEHVTLALQYLHNRFSNDDQSDLVSGQLAVEF